jgi:hypothetical protein
MRIGTALIAAAIAGVSLPALGQTNNDNKALADCVQAADRKYKDTWANISPSAIIPDCGALC